MHFQPVCVTVSSEQRKSVVSADREPNNRFDRGAVKPAFHDTDTRHPRRLADTPVHILARIHARKSRVSDVGVSDESVSMSVSWNVGFKRQQTRVETKQTQVTRSRQDDDTFGRVYCSVRRFVYRKMKGGGVGGASTALGAGLWPYVCRLQATFLRRCGRTSTSA